MPGLTLKNVRPIALGVADAPRDIFDRRDDGTLADAPVPGAREVDGKGAWISPGWADLHVHIWHGGTDISVRAEDAGLPTGRDRPGRCGVGGRGQLSRPAPIRHRHSGPRRSRRSSISAPSVSSPATGCSELIDTRFDRYRPHAGGDRGQSRRDLRHQGAGQRRHRRRLGHHAGQDRQARGRDCRPCR